jgi:geranylgeranyl diphosphate synthase type II
VSTFSQAYSDLQDQFSKFLEEYRKGLRKRGPKELYEPVDYILGIGGKRLRPVLLLAGCDLLGGKTKKALPAALAVEMFHNFSLVHDDILDDAELRRNKPTVHVKWDSGSAILAGDVMLVKSLALLNVYSSPLAQQLSVSLCETAARVCEGQQMDLSFEKSNRVSAEDYLQMIRMKTAELLGCCLQMGAACAGGGKKEQKALYDFGCHMGMSFQLLDDYLDAFADKNSEFGKKIGGDIVANKKTFLLLKAQEKAGPSQKKKLQQLLGKKGDPGAKISATIALFNELRAGEACLAEADRHTAAAISSLRAIKGKKEKKEKLKSFALSLLSRQK